MVDQKRFSRQYNRLKQWVRLQRMPALVKKHVYVDKKKLPETDPGCEIAIKEGINWICKAQDFSKSADGGVARHYSLIDGWGSSYPETTGYIITTILHYYNITSETDLRDRAGKMLDWLVRIQHPEGGFRGGTISEPSSGPVTFNTGQILMGLCAGVRIFGEPYLESMLKAADWLSESQDPDGCWRKNPTPFAGPGEKSYETHVAWGLLEAEKIKSGKGYAESALKNIRWALKNAHSNGWVENCCLTDPAQPLTHTLGYYLRGIIEGYKFKKDEKILNSAVMTAKGLLSALKENGFLPGRLNREWQGTVEWSCLTGTVQVAHCWMELYRITGDTRFWEAATVANSFVRRTMKIDDQNPGIHGGIKGSFPIDGQYGTYQFLNWACKFFIDSNLLEKELREKMLNPDYCGNAELIN